MNLNFDFLMHLADAAATKQTTKLDVLWGVTTFRTNVYRLLYKAGLSQANGQYKGADSIVDEIKAVVAAYAEVIATFPKEIRYSDSQVEEPRVNAIKEAMQVYDGLQSDDNSWESAQELARLVATSEDAQAQQKISFNLLMGIALRILSLLGNVDVMGICTDLI